MADLVATDQLLTIDQTSDLVNVPVGTLRYWRHLGTGPKAFRIGARKIMYKRSDVTSWLEERYAADQAAV